MKPTVLIAEDDPELCGLYQKFIAERGYAVETAADGLECVAKLRRSAPAAVVLDLELCWGGGNGVLAWLREERDAPRVAVILTATAGYSLNGIPVREAPVVRLLLKPFGLAELLDSVRSAVAKVQATRTAGRQTALSGVCSVDEGACP